MTAPSDSAAAPRPLTAVLLVLCAWAAVVLARLIAPSDIATRDQERVAAYVFDITENGHWLAQDDTEGNFASKPPLFNWLSALATTARGSATRLAMSFPSWMSTALTALLILALGARWFGRRAGLWAAILYFASQLGLRQVLLLRTDALFQHLIFVGLWCGFEAAERRASWIGYWLAGLGSTMTKGPLGLLLSAPLYRLFVRGAPVPATSRSRGHAIGIAIFLSIGLAWMFAANAASDGRAFHKLVGDELVGHAIGTKDDFGLPFQRWNRPLAWFLTRLAPMSLLAAVAIGRRIRHREPDSATRRFESCMTWQVVIGLLLFSAASENRFEHLMSIMPATALLAGRECARWFPSRRVTGPLCAVITLAVMSNLYLSWFDAQTTDVAYSESVRRFAAELEPRFRGEDRLSQWSAPRALFVHLGRFAPALDMERIARGLRDDTPLWIASGDDATLRAALDTESSGKLHPILSRGVGRGEVISVWSNRDSLPPEAPEAPLPIATLVAFWFLVGGVLTLAARRAAIGYGRAAT